MMAASRGKAECGMRHAECGIFRLVDISEFAASISGAEFSGELQPGFQQVGGEDADAAQLQNFCEHEANRPLPGHERGVAGQQVQAADGLEDGVDGFEHGAFREGIFGGDFHDAGQDEGHDADVFGVAAARRLESGGDAGALVGLALGEGAVAAEMAIEAGNVMVQGDAVADFEAARETARGGRLAPPPILTMVPAVSWPKMRGGGTVPCWIFLMSVGQTPQTATLTSSSFAPMRGTGTVSRRRSLTPR